MANPGKVLHLYVEVRSVADEERKELKNMEGTHSLMVHGSDVFTQFDDGALNSPHGLVPSAGDLHNVGSSTQGLFTSKSSTRHSDSLQIHSGERQPYSQHGQSLPHDELYQLLFALQPELKRRTGNLVRTRSAESEPFCGRESRICGHFTAPPTPSGGRKTNGQVDYGKRSIVTYKYIEKANVRSVGGHDSILCQKYEPENPFKKTFNTPIIPLNFSEHSSDSPEFNRQEISKNPLTGSVINPKDTPSFKHAMLNSVARNATHRAVHEFGSPEFKHQLATANHLDITLHRDQPRCHSWSGSPVVPRIARTLPADAHLMDLHRHRPLHGVSRSPAAHKLSSEVRNSYVTSCSTSAQSQAIPNQKVWISEETLRQGYRHSPILPSSRPTAIQHELPNKIISQPPYNQTVGQKTSQSPRQHKVNFCLASSSNQSASRVNKPSSEERTMSASCAKMAPDLVPLEARKSSSPTPSLSDTLKSDSTRSGQQSTEEFSTRTSIENNLFAQDQHWEQDPVQARFSSGWASSHSSYRGSRPHASCASLHQIGRKTTSLFQEPQHERRVIPGNTNPASYQHQSPQYTGDNNMLRQEERHCDARGPNKGNSSEGGDSLGMPLIMLSKESRNDSTVLSFKEKHFAVAAQEEFGGLTYGEQSSALAPSSSGVTGSLVEVIQPERDSISPVTSSRTSWKGSGSGNTDNQVRYEYFCIHIWDTIKYLSIFMLNFYIRFTRDENK